MKFIKYLAILAVLLFAILAPSNALAAESITIDKDFVQKSINGGIGNLQLTSNQNVKELDITREALELAIKNGTNFKINMDYATATFAPDAIISASTLQQYAKDNPGRDIRLNIEFIIDGVNDEKSLVCSKDLNNKNLYLNDESDIEVYAQIKLSGKRDIEIKNFNRPITFKSFYNEHNIPYGVSPNSLQFYWLDKNQALNTKNFDWELVGGNINLKETYISFTANKAGLYMAFAGKTGKNGHSSSSFTDIAGHWAESSIINLQNAGIIKNSITKYGPDSSISRAAFCVYLVNFLDWENEPVGNTTFKDVKSQDWFYKEVLIAANKGLAQGVGNGYFGSGDTISRQEIAVMLANALDKTNTKVEIDKNALNKFTDKNQIASWAKSSVEKSVSFGLLGSKGNNKFGPRNNTTRGEAAAIIDRMMGKIAK